MQVFCLPPRQRPRQAPNLLHHDPYRHPLSHLGPTHGLVPVLLLAQLGARNKLIGQLSQDVDIDRAFSFHLSFGGDGRVLLLASSKADEFKPASWAAAP